MSVPARSGDFIGAGGPDRTGRGRGEPFGFDLVSDQARPAIAGGPLPRQRPRVIVVDRDPLATHALCVDLAATAADVIACGASGREGVELARVHSPDVVFVDRATAGPDVVNVIDTLIALNMGIRLVLMTTTWDVEDAVAAIRAGACGCISKADLLAFDLRHVVRAAMADQLVCSRSMGSAILERLVSSPVLGTGFRPVRSSLTAREWEVLDLLCAERSTDGIADALVIAVETVRTHVKNIMRKLNASCRAEILAAAPGLRGELALGSARQRRLPVDGIAATAGT